MPNKNIHQPYNKLKGAMREKDVTVVDMARWLGLSPGTVSKKINGYSDFSLSEANTVMAHLEMGNEIFL